MKLKNNILILAIVICGTVGCSPTPKISVLKGETVYGSLTSLHGTATVENAGGRDVMVESAVFVVHYRDRELGTARLLLPIEIPAGAMTDIRYDFALDDVSLSSIQTFQSRIMTNPDAFTVDVRGYVRWGGMRKKIEFKEVTLTRIMGIISNFAQ